MSSWICVLVLWAFQTVKNLPSMQEIWAQFLGHENPLWRKWQPPPVFLPGEFHGQRSLAGYNPWGHRVEQDWTSNTLMGFRGGTRGTEPACQCRTCKRHGFDPCVRKIPQRRAWQPTPGFWPGESPWTESLAGYSPWGHKKLHTAEANERTHTHL